MPARHHRSQSATPSRRSPRGARSRRSVALARVSRLAGLGVTATALSLVLPAAMATPGPGSGEDLGSNNRHHELVAGNGDAADRPAWNFASQWTVHAWGPGEMAAVPYAHAYDQVVAGRTTKRVTVTSGSNADVGDADTETNVSHSDDGGKTFLDNERRQKVTATNMTRMADGSLIAIDFIPEWTDAGHKSVTIISRVSGDGGRSWSERPGIFTPPSGKTLGAMNRGLRVHRGARVLTDGTLVVPAYTRYVGDDRGSSIFLQSSDGGITWTQRSAVPSTVGTNELGWSPTADGRWFAALRTESAPNSLLQSFSDDEGRTWSPATALLGPDGKQFVGINPQPLLQPNGIMVMASGRPDSVALVSADGTARKWDEQLLAMANPPSTTLNGRFDGTSGNNALVNVASNRSLYIFDTCHIWGCGAFNEQFGVYARYLSAVTPGAGKLDLASKALLGKVATTGDFAPADPRFPEQRPEGAFDGSAEPHSAAVLDAGRGRAPSMTIRLDRMRTLNKLGLMLGQGQPQYATVQLSTDGSNWSAPVIDARGRRDHSIRYTDFAPQPAKYVKITGTAATPTAVTEFEAYDAQTQTFENEPLFAVPRGWTDAEAAWMTDAPKVDGTAEAGGHDSSSSLRLWDKWTDRSARIGHPAAEAERRELAFDFAQGDFRTSFQFDIAGAGGAGGWKFRLRETPQAHLLECFDGATWQPMGTLPAKIAPKTYVPVAVDATADTAIVTVDGQRFTSTTPAGKAGRLAGITLSTGQDPVEYGAAFFIDDVVLR